MTTEEIARLANAAGADTDHTKAPEHRDIERAVAAPGKALARLREYIEIGKHDTKSALYPNKTPERKARFIFELCTPRHIQVIKQEGKEDLLIPHVLAVTVTMPPTGKPAHPKSAYAKLFGKLNYDGKLTHPAQALGRAFIIDIIAGYDKDDYEGGKPKEGAKQKYANFKDADGAFLVSAPRVTDPLTNDVTEVNVPEIKGALKIFLYDRPTKETWDSLFIEGTTTDKDGKTVSKNWLQELILKALDFQGSKLQELLVGAGTTLDDLPTGTAPDDDIPFNNGEAATGTTTAAKDPLAEFGL